jgi:Ca2+-binding EF-hand superfamily protein
LQKEFVRIDKDNSGTLTKWELEEMTSSKLSRGGNVDWQEIIAECDTNHDGVIDFQEFMSACIDRRVLENKSDLLIAFKILDANSDNKISIEDFDDLFSSYGGARMDNELW